MNIKTDRMIIRDFTMNDINDMQDILGDAETMKNCEPAYTIEKTADFLQKFCIEKKGAVAAIRKDTAKVIGYILFNEFNDGVYEIGWFFNRAFWRQGFAYESCKAVIDYAFDKMNAHKVFAETIDGIKSVHPLFSGIDFLIINYILPYHACLENPGQRWKPAHCCSPG